MDNLIKLNGGGNNFLYYFLDVSAALADNYSRTIKNLSVVDCYAVVSTFQKIGTSYTLNTVAVDGTNVPAEKDTVISNGYRSGCFVSKIKSTSEIVVAGHETYGAIELVMLLLAKPTTLGTAVNRGTTSLNFSSNKNIMIVGLADSDGPISSTTFVISCNKEVIFYRLETTYCIAFILGNDLKAGTVTDTAYNSTIHIYEF
jgi:hypothetical protein